MGSQNGGANSTRLSLDIADLPLTPFGMSPKHPSRKHTLFSQRTNKLSLKSHKERENKESCLQSKGENGKENMNPKNHQYHLSSYTMLDTVSEETSSPPVASLETDNDHTTLPSSGTSEDGNMHQMQVNVHMKKGNNVASMPLESDDVVIHRVQGQASTKESNMPVNMPQVPRRQSTYTDIDEGSFIEFCQDEDECRPIPTQIEQHFIPQLYYTCDSQNDTQFSTSTKTKNCLVGFRKFLEAFKKERELRSITEESEVEPARETPPKKFNFNCDETIITCSADVAKRIIPSKEQQQQQVILNSTVIDRLPCEASVRLPNVFPDVSTLTMPSETVSSSGSGNNSPVANLHRRQKGYACNSNQSVIAISESSDESENFTLQRTAEVHVAANLGGRNIYVQKHGYSQNILSPSSPQPSARTVNLDRQSLISEDASSNDEMDYTHTQTAEGGRNAIQEGKNIYAQKHSGSFKKSPNDEDVNVPGQSLISEDVSIVSSILPTSCTQSPGQHVETRKNSLSQPWNPRSHCENARKSPHHLQSPGKSSSQPWNLSGHCEDTRKSPSCHQNPAKSSNCPWTSSDHEKNGKSSGVKCDDRGKLVYVDIDKDSQVVYDYDGEDEAENAEPQDQRPGTPENAKNPATARWIMTSPFHEGSFGTSFMENLNNSSSSESLHQFIPTSSLNNMSQQSSDKRLEPKSSYQPVQEGPKQRCSSVRQGKISIPIVVTSSDDESEENLRLKRSVKACRVIQSSSSDSDEPSVQHHVTRRRKLSFEKRRGGLLARQNKVVESSDSSSSSPEESLHLRLSESHSRISEKTVKTIGRIAKSPCNIEKSSVLSPCSAVRSSVLSPRNNMKPPVLVPSSDESDEVLQRRPRAHIRWICSSESDQCEKEPVSLPHHHSDSLPDVEVDTSTSSDKLSTNGTKSSYTTPLQKQRGGSTQSRGSDTNLRLRKLEDEPDKVYCTDLRKNQTKRLITASKNRKKATIQEDKASIRDTGNVHKTLKVQSGDSDSEDEREDNLMYQIEETIDISSNESFSDESGGKNHSNDKKELKQRVSTIHKKSRLSSNSDDDNNDSFEEYLRRVKKQIEEEKGKNKNYVRANNLDEYESSFIDDGSSEDDDVSYRLPSPPSPSHARRPLFARLHESGSTTDDPLEKPPNIRVGGPGTSNTSNSPLSGWRAQPAVTVDSDSDAEVFPVSQTKKSKAPPKLKPFITPQKPFVTPKALIPPPKPFPITEGHKKTTSRQYPSGVNYCTPTLSFLASLSSTVNMMRCHPDALVYTKNFKRKREELAEKLYKYYNTHVFNCKLPAELNIKWNNRMTKTAGFCYYQIDRSKPCGRGSRIELATKVIDCPERLRDTLIHELCHAASWIISGYKAGHGPLWKAWASKAKQTFPELPPITRCHSYAIQCRYTYRCTHCSYSIGRHSKSLDTKKKVCGLCYGRFELIDNNQRTPHKNSTNPSQLPHTPKTPGPFALFVQENYGTVKKSGGGLKHADVMKALSAKFRKMKTTGIS